MPANPSPKLSKKMREAILRELELLPPSEANEKVKAALRNFLARPPTPRTKPKKAGKSKVHK